MTVIDITPWRLAAGYLLFIIPFGIALWLRVGIIGQMAIAIVRMTVQLLFVGLYLHGVFDLNNPWLNSVWLLVMICVADVSITRGCGIQLKRFSIPLFVSLSVGTAIPLIVFLGPILSIASFLDAQYVIPIGGMILGNCLRADIIGVKHFYESIKKDEKAFLHALAQGARPGEAMRPYFRDAFHSALAPMIATMATIGLVALPGMMTGVILAGADPTIAIKYQIAIMIAIFSGTAVTVTLAVILTVKSSFTPFGILDTSIFTQRTKKQKGQTVR